MAIRIPFEYQEVEYIKATGTQYINSGLSPSLTHGVKAVYDVSDTGSHTLFGAITSAGVGYFGLQHNNGKVEVCWGSGNSTSQTYSTDTQITVEFNYENSRVVTFNGSNIYTLSTSPTITAYPIYIFALNYTNSPSQYFSGKLYSMQITNGTELVRDFVPCYRKSDGEAGLYCIVNNTFFPNLGTGEFEVGADVNRVDRKFQSGVVGSTNVIEGSYIADSRGQLVNYVMLYDSGDECEEITGGWDERHNSNSQNYSNFNTSYIGHISSGYTGRSNIYTNNPIEFSDKKGIFVKFERTSSYQWSIDLVTKNIVGQDGEEGDYIYYSESVNGINVMNFDIPNTDKARKYVYIGAACNGKTYCVATYYADDWSTLAEKANITASSIADILSKSSTLLANSDAVNFMCKKCTGDFMASAVASDTFLTALASSPYKNKVYANEHWAKFLAMVA